MRQTRRAFFHALFLVAYMLAFSAPSACAQLSRPGVGRSLGGYGAATIGQYYSDGTTSYLPYNGRAGGFVPYRGGDAGGFGFQPVPRGLPQTPIGGISMPVTPIGGASTPSGLGARAGGGAFTPFGYEGTLGLGASMIRSPRLNRDGMRLSLGLGFGYPF